MKFIKSIYLRILVYFICAVCIYDIYCTVNCSEFLYDRENNPIAKMLIKQEELKFFPNEFDKKFISIIHTNVSKLVLFKVLGLVAALEIFDWLISSKHHKIAQSVIFFMVLFQLSLLLYLAIG